MIALNALTHRNIDTQIYIYLWLVFSLFYFCDNELIYIFQFTVFSLVVIQLTSILLNACGWFSLFLCGGFRYAITKAFCVAFLMTFFSMFDVPVFWPILLCYWIVLFVLTMKRQIMHMIKYKYVPFNIGKQVSLAAS